MKTALIIVAVLVASPFVLGFVWAAISAILGTCLKKERSAALVLLSQVPEGAMGLLLTVFSTFKLQNIDEANRRTGSAEAAADALIGVLARPHYRHLDAILPEVTVKSVPSRHALD